MDQPLSESKDTPVPQFLSGGGEMGSLIRSFDWSKTPLGSPDSWPQSLRTTVSLCLASNFPIAIAWGRHRVQIYNDGYWPITGDMHPASMGQDFKECWSSAWPVIGQAFEEASLGQTRFLENQRIFLDRYGYIEETFFTFSFSPILDESGGVGGLFHPVIELTQQTLAERRLNILRALPDHTVNARTADEASALILECLKDFERDIPFVLLYSIAADGKEANLQGSIGVERDSPLAPVKINLQVQQSNSWPFTEVTQKGSAVQVNELGKIFETFNCGPYPEPPKQALVFPVTLPGTDHNKYLLVTGVSSRRSLDEKYLLFYDLLTASITNALTKARAQDEERKKAEALAEIDKAKTVFFSNISHEFRTPLTLMLGSLEELLNKRNGEIETLDNEAIETSHRNAMRLLRLVNNLLDFSRIEAGRVQARYQLTDLAKYTTELASNFRSVVEAAGLKFQVKTEAVIQPVYVDKEMWEKIVLNLLSNAFKYTLSGSITVTLDMAPLSKKDSNMSFPSPLGEGGQRPDEAVEGLGVRLSVSDTGVGIPEMELPKMFQRFHRVQNVVGRTYEGTGIGLSLVSELVKLHGGDIRVQSTEGEGSVFTVSIPTGKLHLPTEHVLEKELDFTTSLTDAFIEEATTLIDHSVIGNRTEYLKENADAATVLVVDDNADMRGYIKNLLQKQYHVVTANNGMDALHQMKEHAPQLILSDIMMPVMDGIELLKAVKENVQTANIPVILLSARAGEESKIEGYHTGADDYLVKPFSAKELMARVASQLKLVKLRQATEANVRSLFMQAPAAICVLRGPQHIYQLTNAIYLQLIGNRNVVGKPIRDALPELEGTGIYELLDKVYKTGKPFIANEMPVTLQKGNGINKEIILNFEYHASRNENGEIDGILVYAVDVTEQVIARKKIEESKEQLRIAIEAGEFGMYDFYPQSGELIWSAKTKELFGLPPESKVDYPIYLEGLHPEDKERAEAAVQWAFDSKTGGLYENEYRTIGITDGKLRWVRSKGKIIFDAEGKPLRFTGVIQDITRQKEILTSLQLQSLVLDRMDEGVSVSDENGIILLTNSAEDEMFGYEAGELVGKHVTVQNAYQPDENEKIVADVIAELKQKGFWSGEWHNQKKDGTSFHTHSFITSLVIDGKTLFVCVQRDITEEKAASEKLTYRTALLEAQNEAIPDAILIVDTKGKMLSFNHHFVTLWKIPQEIINRKDDAAALQFAMTQLTDPQGFIDRVNYCYAHPDKKAREEVLFKDGRIIERYGNAVLGEGGRSYGWAWYFRDITEQKHAEEKLLESESRFRSLADESPMFVFIIEPNAEATISYWNKTWLTYTGQSPEEALGRAWEGIIHPDDVPVVLEYHVAQFEKREAYFIPAVRVKRNDGDYRWHTFKGTPRYLADGGFNGYVGVGFDIHEQKLAEEALKESEERFRSFSNSIYNLAWMADGEGYIYWYNQRWYDYTGTTLEEMKGWGWGKVHHPAHVDRVVGFVKDAWKKPEPFELTFPLRSKEGEYRWFLTRCVPILNEEGNIQRWIGTNTDINEQKLAEERFRTLSETLPQLVWMTDEKGVYEYASNQWMEYSGLDPYNENTWKTLVYASDMEPMMKAWTHSLSTGETYHAEARLKNKEGEYRWHFVQGKPVKDEEGKILKWIGAFTDIHEQKTISTKLEALVIERTKELQRSNEDLQQFAHVASHDLKEPIRKVRTFGSRLKEEFSEALPEKAKVYINKMETAADRMYAMIDGVLLYSSVNAMEQTKEQVDLNEVLQNIETDLEMPIAQKNAIIEHGNLPVIEGSSILLYQLFYNLINNSLKFTKAGVAPVIKIKSESTNGKDLDNPTLNDNQVYEKITLHDNGIGFNPSESERIFQTFLRLNSKDKYEGTGLGLALCRKIAERHDGVIYAESIEGQGSVFTILLPK